MRHAGNFVFQLAEVMVTSSVFEDMLDRKTRLRPLPG